MAILELVNNIYEGFENNQYTVRVLIDLNRASDISRGRGPAKFPKKREIPQNPPEIFPNTCRQNIFDTYLGN